MDGTRPLVPQMSFRETDQGRCVYSGIELRHNEMLEEVSAAAGSAETAGTTQDDLPPYLRTELDTLMSSADVAFYLSKDIAPEILRMTLKRYMMEKKRGFSSQNELAQVLATALSFGKKKVEPASSDSAGSSPANAKEIPERLICRVCLDRERGVVFIPCGHCVTCPTCAASVTECVVCRSPIQGTVLTFIS